MRIRSEKFTLIDKKIGSRWRESRKLKGLTLEDVCTKLNEAGYSCNKASLGNLENGRSQPMHYNSIIMLLCSLYGTDPNSIYGSR